IVDFAQAADTKGFYVAANDVTVSGFEIRNAHQECVQTWSKGITFRRNHIHDCGLLIDFSGEFQGCIQAEGSNELYEQNRVHDCGSHIIYVTGDGTTIRNNLLYKTDNVQDRGRYGIQVGTSCSDGSTTASNILIANNMIGESDNRSSIVLYTNAC